MCNTYCEIETFAQYIFCKLFDFFRPYSLLAGKMLFSNKTKSTCSRTTSCIVNTSCDHSQTDAE